MSAIPKSKWYRVTKKHPCPICERPDWCGYADGAVCCMRVESDRPTNNGGWLHLEDRPIPVRVAPLRVTPDCQINFDLLWKRHSERTTPDRILSLAENLGVESWTLDMIGCVWMPEHCAYGFPMKDGETKVIGMRLRNTEGKKWAVKGSKSGLFLPVEFTGSTVFIAEGPTDVAAGLGLGLHVIGRPACLGQEQMVVDYIRLFRFNRAVVISDNDGPGFKGAVKLQSMLRVPSAMYLPPCKDLRQFVSLGGDAEVIRSTIKDLVWQMPK